MNTLKPSGHINRKGFTLIEVVFVIAIIVILASMLMPNIVGFDKEARVATTKGNLTTLRSRINLFRAKTGNYPSSLEELLTKTYFDAGVQMPYLKTIPLELISDKSGNASIENITSNESLKGDGGYVYIKDKAEVLLDWVTPLGPEWEQYAGQNPSEW